MSTVLINILTEYIYSGKAVTPSMSRLLMPYVAVDTDSTTTNIFLIPTRSKTKKLWSTSRRSSSLKVSLYVIAQCNEGYLTVVTAVASWIESLVEYNGYIFGLSR
jgi:hypothetical protein